MRMALEGIRVLEWSQWQAGPAAGVLLADLGAEVIKIETPIGGDQARGIAAITGLVSFANGRDPFFEVNNRNKKGITLDLRTERAKQIVYELVPKCDVFLHNFRESSVLKMGVDYETLVKHNPKLVYVQLNGNGPLGPESDDRSYDLPGQARSGIMFKAGEPGGPPQLVHGGGIGDQAGSMMAAYGTVVALLARERLGIGQKVDASILGALVGLQQFNVAMKLISGEEQQRKSRKHVPSALYNYYQCADGKWLVLACPQPDRYWAGVCRVMGLEHDTRFTDPELRRTIVPELISRMDEVFMTKPRAEWMALFKEHGVNCSPLNDYDDLVHDPQVLANEYITGFDHPVWGPVKEPGIVVRFNETPGRLRTAAPGLGEHTEEVLTGLLGYDAAKIAELRYNQVI